MTGPAMTTQRAHQIVKAICQRSFVSMGLHDGPVLSLEGVTLSDMLAAAAEVRAENEQGRERSARDGGGYSFSAVPDDRLIAVVYALENYDPGFDDENVLAAATPMKGEFGQDILKAIYVIRATPKDERGALQ